MFEQITVIGHIGKVTKGSGATPYIRVAIAASVSFKDKKGKMQENTNWYSTTLWDEKRIAQYKDKLQKGDLVLVVGTPAVRIYEKDGKKGIDFSIATEFGGRFKVLRYAADGTAAETV
jgi:single-stranded DNA-binding protein